MEFSQEPSLKAALKRAGEEAIRQSASDWTITELIHAHLAERDAFDLCMSLFPNSDAFKRASKLLDEATRYCQRLLAAWQPTHQPN